MPENSERYGLGLGEALVEFVPSQSVDLSSDTLFIATVNQNSGETFVLIPLSMPVRSQIAVKQHSASLRLVYSDFPEEGASQIYRQQFI
jgi:hypothetical protein